MKRVISASVLIPLACLIIQYSSSFLFSLVLAVITVLVQREYHALAFKKGFSYPLWLYLASGLLIPISFYLSLPLPNILGFLISLFSLFLYQLFSSQDHRVSFNNLSWGCFGLVYGSLFLSFLITIKNSPQGEKLLFLILLLVWAGDTAAYYVGRNFGKHKLAPQISPNKTVEGAIGGLVGGGVAVILFKLFFFPQLAWTQALFLSVVMGIIGQMGDLVESVLKRSAEVKDSGQLIPGHGGIMDRLDSLILIVPFYYYYLQKAFALP